MAGQTRRQLAARKNLRIGIIEGILATPWVFLSIPSSFIIAALVTQYFGIGPAVFGLIVALPALANALQIFYLPMVRTFLSPRDMALAPSWLNLGLWLMFGLALPLLPPDDPQASAGFLIAFFAFTSFCSSLIGVGWTSWVQNWVPSKVRGKYFGRRNLAIQFTTVAFLLLAMLLLEGPADSVVPFQMLIFLSVGFRFFSILWQHLIVLVNKQQHSKTDSAWHRDIVEVWKHRPFRIFCFFAFWVVFWMNSMGPFAIVYAFNFLELTKSHVAVLTIIATLAGAALMPLWGRMIDRHGCVKIIIVSITTWWCTGYSWALLTPDTTWILYLVWFFGGALSGGFVLGVFNLLFKVVPEGKLTAGISLNMCISSAAGAAAPMLVGLILGAFPEGSSSQQIAYKSLFVVATTAIIFSGFLAARIPERKSTGSSLSLVGAMRSMRATMISLGLGFLNNTNLIRLVPKNKQDGKE